MFVIWQKKNCLTFNKSKLTCHACVFKNLKSVQRRQKTSIFNGLYLVRQPAPRGIFSDKCFYLEKPLRKKLLPFTCEKKHVWHENGNSVYMTLPNSHSVRRGGKLGKLPEVGYPCLSLRWPKRPNWKILNSFWIMNRGHARTWAQDMLFFGFLTVNKYFKPWRWS